MKFFDEESKSLFTSKVVWVAALGNFVDVYDLVLFGIVRVVSLQDIGVSAAELLPAGARLLHWQMAGMLAGGLAWGVLGDRLGRLRALYGSILLYSLANLANAFVTDLSLYAVLRFLAGFGLAGELGAAITLVAESVPKSKRSLGAAIVGVAGFLGAVCSVLLSGLFTWRISYLLGGVLGLLLLAARVRVAESPLFLRAERTQAAGPGPLRRLFLSPARLGRFLRCVLVGAPVWFFSGVLFYFAPEIGRDLSVSAPVLAGHAILWGYVGSILGDPLIALLSQRWRSRKLGILVFLLSGAALLPLFFLLLRGASPTAFYAFCFLLGVVNGYWVLFVALTAEQFGTDIRATVATSAPNFVRGLVIPMTAAVFSLSAAHGTTFAALSVGLGCLLLAIACLLSLPETFTRDLEYTEG